MLQKGKSGLKVKLLNRKYIALKMFFSYCLLHIKGNASQRTVYDHSSKWEGTWDILNNVSKI